MKGAGFVLPIVAFSLGGLLFPDLFTKLRPLIVPLLALIMLSMGLTLRGEDFLRIFRSPHIILYGALLQFSVMPLGGYLISKIFGFDADLTTGMVLVGSAPGGTASNLITFLSKGNLAYSVSMTSLSTLLAPLFTPGWTYILVGKLVSVPFLQMAITTFKIIVIPVALGMLFRKLLKERVRYVEPVLPVLAVWSIGLIIGVIFALNSNNLKEISFILIGAVLLHNLVGFLLGYTFGRVAGLNSVLSKTLSIEVGMQNSGLSSVLALKFFSPEVALPSALFSLIQNMVGLLLSLVFKRL